MHYLNNNEDKKNNNRHYLIAAATGAIFTLAIAILVGAITSIATTPVAATTTTATTASSSSSSGIQLSPQPIYQERSPEGNITPINETHGIFTFSGNGTLTLPNTTQTINTTNNGTAIISFTTSSGYGTETIRTENGEAVTATLYEIVQFNPAAPEDGGEGKGIVTALFQTNSTGVLAPLNGMIAAGIDDMSPSGESRITLWRWESGIPLPTGNAPGAEQSPLSAMNTTTTNATTSTTNVTAATDDEGESQEEIVEEAVGGAKVAE